MQTDVSRGCFPGDSTPVRNGCLDGETFYDLTSNTAPEVEILGVTGRVCFCEGDLCNDKNLLQEVIGKFQEECCCFLDVY